MSDIKSAQAQTFAPVDYATWRAEAERSLRGGGTFESRLVSKTLDGFEVQPLYSEFNGDNEYPGVAPFTRGSDAVPAEEGWEIRQEFSHPDLKTTNAQILRDLERGVSGISLVLDHGFARGHNDAVKRGVPIRDGKDLESALQGVHLSMVGFSAQAGINAHGLLAALADYAARSGQKLKDLRGTLGYDPVSQLLADGTVAADAKRLFDLGADLAHFCRSNAPKLRPILVSGRSVQEAGASEGQEIAWALALGIEWMRALTSRGLSANDAAQSITFQVSVARDIFLEIAKLRAMRHVWARALEAIGVDEAFRAIELNARGSNATLSQRDPWVNMLRITGHTFSASLGGAQSVTTPSFDEAIAIPEEFGRRIARNTQLILRDESHLVRVQDAAGGSFYLESMTQNYAKIAWETMQSIESAGGAIAYAVAGALTQKVADARGHREKQIATRRLALTGVSEFPNLTEKPVEAAALSPVQPQAATGEAGATAQAIAKGAFDGSVANAAIEDLKQGANTLAILQALTTEAATNAPALPAIRYAGPWEELRDAADGLAAKQGGFPQLFLANIGRIPEHRPRSSYAQNLFAAGGIHAENNDGFPAIDQAVDAFKASGLNVACICSTDAQYADVAAPLAKALKAAGARQVILAGKPGDNEADWRNAGIDTFIYMGADALGIMRETLAGFGADLASN